MTDDLYGGAGRSVLPSALEARDLRKRYGAITAVDDVTLTAEFGQTHMILGENGAGKSTLINILSGLLVPDGGDVLVNGKRVRLGDPKAAKRAGITVVPQSVRLVDELSVGRNVLLGGDRIRTRRERLSSKERQRVAKALESMGLQLDPDLRAGDLSVPERRLVQIAKALLHPGDIIILDEPTAVLSEPDSRQLLSRISALRDAGKAVIYITHRLNEVFEAGDRITCLRDGKIVGAFPSVEVDGDLLIELMTKSETSGAVHTGTFREPESAHKRDTALQVLDLRPGGDGEAVTFEGRGGEVVCFAGVQGAGHGRVVKCIAGIEPYSSGVIRLGDRTLIPGNARDSCRGGIQLVPADRLNSGIVGSQPIYANIALSPVSVKRGLSRGGFRLRGEELSLAERYLHELDIQPRNAVNRASSLSGGNQQKVSIARALAADPDVLLLEEPTQGISVHSKMDIRKMIRRLADELGYLVIVATSEFEEAVEIADRVHVMRKGRIVGTLSGEEKSYRRVLELAIA